MNSEINLGKQRAAIYARVSSSKQSEEGTIESQISMLEAYAKNHGFEIPEGWVFQDNGISGSVIQRPALDNLRDLVASGNPDVILIYHPDRLARKYVYQALLLEEFNKCGIEVIFYKNKKAETPEEHLLEQFQGVFAEYERAQITERCRRGRLHKAKQGSVTVLPNAAYGYRYIRDKENGMARYEIDPKESEAVLKLFQMYSLDGKGIGELCSYMNKSDLKPRRSTRGWDRESIRRILRNRAYIGSAGFCKTEKSEGNLQRIVRGPKNGRSLPKRARKNLPEESWITIPVPAIVPENIYRMVQDKLNGARQFATRNTKIPSILQGILVCADCGGSYYKKSRKNARTYYCCHRTLLRGEKKCKNRSIRQNELDDYVWEWVISILRNPELIENEINRRLKEDPEEKRAITRKVDLYRQQKRLMNSRNKLLDAYTEGECLSLEELKKRMQILNQQIQQVERELSILEAQTNHEERIKESRLTFEKFRENLENSSKDLSIQEKQRVVRALIHEIEIYEDFVNIKHCIPIGNEAKSDTKKCPLLEQRYF